MVSLTLIPILLSLLQTALAQSNASCKCDGSYANGKKVSGCANGACSSNPATNTRCVTIYRDQIPIGNDCLPWPAHVANCATFDDGSRICANDVCKPTLLGGEKGECAAPVDDGHHVLLAGQVNRQGLDFVMGEVKRQVEIIVANLSIPNQKMQQSGFDVTVTDIKIAQFISPSFSYVLLPPASIKLIVKGGDFKVCAKWEAKKSIINPGGDICIWSERIKGTDKPKGVEVEVTAKITINEKGQLRLETSDCKLQPPIDLKLTGALGSLVNLFSGWVEDFAEKQAGVQVCAMLDKAVKTTVAGILDELPRGFKINDMYGVGYTFRGINFHDGGIRAQLGANGTVGQKGRRVNVPLMEL